MDHELTRLLEAWRAGARAAGECLVERLYGELKALAAARLGDERAGHTRQPTALVHEAWERLARLDRMEWKDRQHFLAMAAKVMRDVLVDHARRRRAAKRDWGRRVTWNEADGSAADQDVDVLDLDAALGQLEEIDPVKARLVELRFFGGLSIEEAADALDLSSATVKRHWRSARAWLLDALEPEP